MAKVDRASFGEFAAEAVSQEEISKGEFHALGGAALFLFEPVFRRFFSVSLDYLAGFQIELNRLAIPADISRELPLAVSRATP